MTSITHSPTHSATGLRFVDLAHLALLRKPASALSLLQPTVAAAAAARIAGVRRPAPAAAAARSSLPLRLADAMTSAMVQWSERARMRNELLDLDERALKDVGLSRADVIAERSKPFWQA